jgi:hypothetical protein
MIDQRNPQLIVFHAGRRFRWLNVSKKAGGRFAPAGELPSQGIEKAARLGRVRIKEALPVKMPWKRPWAGMLHESSFTHSFQRGERNAGPLSAAGFRYPDL